MKKRDDVEKRVGEAIKLFWLTRDKQSKSQGTKTGQKDAGLRAAVTGGKHLDGFTDICRDLFIHAGLKLMSFGETVKNCPATTELKRTGI